MHLFFLTVLQISWEKNRYKIHFVEFSVFYKAYLKIEGFVAKKSFFLEQAKYWATFTV